MHNCIRYSIIIVLSYYLVCRTVFIVLWWYVIVYRSQVLSNRVVGSSSSRHNITGTLTKNGARTILCYADLLCWGSHRIKTIILWPHSRGLLTVFGGMDNKNKMCSFFKLWKYWFKTVSIIQRDIRHFILFFRNYIIHVILDFLFLVTITILFFINCA